MSFFDPIDLLPCPHCGGNAYKKIETIEGLEDFNDYDVATVECENPDCRALMQDADHPRSHDIENRWNKRVV